MSEDHNERIHQYLDGDLQHGELGTEELREASRHDRLIAETRKIHQSIETPDLTAGIMARIAARSAGAETAAMPGLAARVREIYLWLWIPRPVSIRPAYGIAGAAAICLLMIVFSGNIRVAPDAPQSAKVFIQFRIDAPQASAVHLAGSFTGWKPAYTLHETAPGSWSVLVPLEPGVHDYAFVVNGQWITDPLAPAVDDGFGGANSRLMFVLPESDTKL